MIEVVQIAYTDKQWNAIKAVVRDARGLDADAAVVLETLRAKIEATATLHLVRDKAMRSLPSQMKFRKHLTGLRDDAVCLRDGIIGSPAFWATHNGHAPDDDMRTATRAYFAKLLRNLDGIVDAIGPPRKKTGSAASKNRSRDLFWSDLLAIWRQIGGRATGADAADFLIAVSVPVFNAMPRSGRDAVPDRQSVIQWLRRRSPIRQV